MTVIAPTLLSERWGPEKWQLFHYWANPIRDGGGNPCIIWRHGGGGTIGNYTAVGAGGSSVEWPILQYFLLQPNLGQHFDIISAQSAQQTFPGTNSIRRTLRMNMWGNVFDHQRMVASIKAWGVGMLGGNWTTSMQIDPEKIITGGDSFGATVTGLSMIRPPLVGRNSWKIGVNRQYEADRFDSQPLGVIYHRGQVDFRKRLLINPPAAPALLNYLTPSEVNGIYGTREADAGTEWDSFVPNDFKEAVSLLAYIENGYTDYYRPMFVQYANEPTFLGVYPLASNHDKKMGEDLVAALKTRGNLAFSEGLSPDQTPEGGPQFAPDPLSQSRIYKFCEDLVKARPARTGAIR